MTQKSKILSFLTAFVTQFYNFTHLVNGDLITRAAGVDVRGHLVRKEVKTAPGEFHTGKREYPGELACDVHLHRFCNNSDCLKNNYFCPTLDPGRRCCEKLLSVTGEKTNMCALAIASETRLET